MNIAENAKEKNTTRTGERNTTFTGLGMSGSGKTNYIAGMYYVMSSGEKGWTVMTGDKPTQDKLGRWTDQLDNKELGNDRFLEGNRIETTIFN